MDLLDLINIFIIIVRVSLFGSWDIFSNTKGYLTLNITLINK